MNQLRHQLGTNQCQKRQEKIERISRRDIRSRRDVGENKGNLGMMPRKIGENRTCFLERYKIYVQCRRKQRKSRRVAGKDKRKSDTMPENRGFGHDAKEPLESLGDPSMMLAKTKEIQS